MTCKDCYHYDVCNTILKNALSCDVNDCSQECQLFKDKLKIIELPCKVGDKIYNTDDMRVRPIGFDDDYILCFVISDDGLYFETECHYQRNISEIGKTVFLSKEAAVQALMENRRTDNEK